MSDTELPFVVMAAMPDGSPEIFTSIQGEGPKSGALTVFVRLSSCNLYCSWCDTPYTWRWSSTRPHDDEMVYERRRWQVKMPPPDLTKDILRRGPKRVVFTGGEPFLQHARLMPVLEELHLDDFALEFETNGTILPPSHFLQLSSLIVVSPKLANSGIPPSVRTVEPALAGLAELEQTVFKFVVSGPADFDEIASLQGRFGIAANRVWIMPCGRSVEATTQVGRAVINQVITSGYNYSARLHLALFGDTQGT